MVSVDNLGSFAVVPLEVEGVLDRRTMTVEEILGLEQGSLIRLDRSAGENIEISVGATPVAYGEVVVVENKFCIRVTDLRQAHE